MSKLTSSLEVRFGAEGGLNIPLVITGDAYLSSGNGRRLRVYPADPSLRIVTNVGAVAKLGSRLDIVTEAISFSSSDKVGLRYKARNFTSLAVNGLVLDTKGDVVTDAVFVYSAEENAIVCNRVCFAALIITYEAYYELVEYTPGDNQLITTIGLGRITASNVYGVVIAILGTQTATFDVEPPDYELSLGNEIEIYRVVTTGIATADNFWEKPEGWPNTGRYNNGLDGPDPDEPNMGIERTHQIGVLTAGGATQVFNYNVPPASGPSGYRPQYQLKKASTPTDPTYGPLYSQINVALINRNIQRFGLTW